MANQENIDRHKFNVMDKERQRQIASMGGKKTAENRRQMVRMSECLSFLMSRPLSKEDNKNINQLLGTEGESYTNAMAMVVGVAGQARKGNIKAAYLVAQLMGDLTEKVETTVNSITPGSVASARLDEMTDEQIQERMARLDKLDELKRNDKGRG